MQADVGLSVAQALIRGAGICALKMAVRAKVPRLDPDAVLPMGVSVVIPSRNGKELLARLLPGVFADLVALRSQGCTSQVIVSDNGSDDGTSAFLSANHPDCTVETHTQPLSFASAVNRGLARARYSHVCLLNNDMVIEPGFFAALRAAFEAIPGLFCSTAQIFLPSGARREETGKAVMSATDPRDFPIRCELPLEGEDLSYVLYGSGGCSLYDAAKLHALGLVDEAYAPAYVEDLDLGYRAWALGWPTVFAANARVEHQHRSTTSRYYSEEELETVLEINYLRFLARAVSSPRVFWRLWRRAIGRLRRLASDGRPAALAALKAGIEARSAPATVREDGFLALTAGKVAVFPGEGTAPARVHWCDRLDTPARELLDRHREVVLVERSAPKGAFEAALDLTRRKRG
ncbi:MAG: glycosyltransferase [Bryobacterales bacterium]|nr:glycosyltransferase [Bryobacterales bacterium]